MEILLLGGMIDAEEAYRIGLVNRIVPAAELDAEAQKIALQIAANGPRAIRAIKESVLRGLEMPLADAYVYETELVSEVFQTEEAREGLAAFAEKRTPDFRAAKKG
jgi:enoyl-CoA hydratase/carnithine racemase